MSSNTTPTITYVADPRSDIVLRSSDNVDFLVRRVHLVSASPVFDDMFEAASDAQSEKDKDTGLPVVKLNEKSQDLDLLLRFIVRDQPRPDVLAMSLESSLALLTTADKFGIETARDLAASRLGTLAVQGDPTRVLGPALALRQLALSRAALSRMDGPKRWNIISNERHSPKYLAMNPRLLSSINPKWVERIPSKTLMTLMRQQERVMMYEDDSWAKYAPQFKFD